MEKPIVKIYSLDGKEYLLFNSFRVKTGYENHLIYFDNRNERSDYALAQWEVAQLVFGGN